MRLSLTDRCDLACIYCRPERADGYLAAEERLPFFAWQTMVRGLLAAGVRRVRITGGEPLLHPDVVEMVGFLATQPLDDLALTTNATQLTRLAAPLRRAGLRRVNISLDSLDADRFCALTRGGRLASVLAGVDAAIAAGFDEIKINAVVVRGENDDELEALTQWAWARNLTPRFLEVMAVGEGARLQDRVVTVAEMRRALAPLLDDSAVPTVERDRGPARYVWARDQRRRVGFISGTSDTFCAGCDRLRVASDGILRPCLASNDGVAAGAAARSAQIDAVGDAVRAAWRKKPDGESWKGCTEPTAKDVSMRGIGG